MMDDFFVSSKPFFRQDIWKTGGIMPRQVVAHKAVSSVLCLPISTWINWTHCRNQPASSLHTWTSTKNQPSLCIPKCLPAASGEPERWKKHNRIVARCNSFLLLIQPILNTGACVTFAMQMTGWSDSSDHEKKLRKSSNGLGNFCETRSS